MKLKFTVLDGLYCIYRFSPGKTLPEWIYTSEFYSVTRTQDEISVVSEQKEFQPEGVANSCNWKVIKIIGPLEFSLVGLLADITNILKQEGVSLFALSTYDTDYILVKEGDLDRSVKAMEGRGYLYVLR